MTSRTRSTFHVGSRNGRVGQRADHFPQLGFTAWRASWNRDNLLPKEGIEVVTAGSPAGALAEVAAEAFDAALIDLNYTRDTTSGAEGLNLLDRLHQSDPLLPVIVMTAWASVDLAVQAMRAGARDFIEKPWENARLLSVIRQPPTATSFWGYLRGTARRMAAKNWRYFSRSALTRSYGKLLNYAR